MTKEKQNLKRLWRRLHPNRKYKDQLFQRIFTDKKDLLELYNVYIEKHNLNIYGRIQIPLPMPQYIVFYNGKENLPDESLLKLSDAFTPAFTREDSHAPILECMVRMFNINPGHNQTLLNSCKRLHDYSIFISAINQNLAAGLSLEDAICSAIDNCIKNHVLEDILTKCTPSGHPFLPFGNNKERSEVYHMLLTKYDEKKVLKMTYQEGMDEGFERGIERGLKQGHTQGMAQGTDRVNQLIRLLAEQDRTDDIIKAANDRAYQKKLFEEFHI